MEDAKITPITCKEYKKARCAEIAKVNKDGTGSGAWEYRHLPFARFGLTSQ